MAKLTKAEAEELLPDPRKSKPRPEGLVYLVIAPPKWGKTTTFSAVPDALLIAFERGYQFQTIPTIFVDAWDAKNFEAYTDDDGVNHLTMKQVMEVLTTTDKFKFVIFDTADMAAKKCTDYHLQKHGWQHAQDGGDFGKGYDIVQNAPFRQMIGAIMSTGRGIALITHSEVKTTEFKKGAKSKRETSLPGGVHKFLHTQADVIMHGSFGVKQKGNRYRDRIVQTEGDEETLAGNRTRELNIPPRFILDPADPWGQWCRFFRDSNAADVATAELAASASKRMSDRPEEDEEDVASLQPKVGKKI